MRVAYVYFMKNDPDQVRTTAPRHVAHWHTASPAAYEGGPFGDRSGGLITFEADSLEDAERLVTEDPFVTDDLLAAHWVKEWRPE